MVGVISLALAVLPGVLTGPAQAKRARTTRASSAIHQLNGSRLAGDARLAWRPRHSLLVVRLRLKHLPAKSRAFARIEAGTCAGDSHAARFALHSVAANEFGGGHSTTRVFDVTDPDFGGSWHITVYRVADFDRGTDPPPPVACGDVRPLR